MTKSPLKPPVTPARRNAGTKPGTSRKSAGAAAEKTRVNSKTGEVGGPEGPEPTRYGDWEKNGRCVDF